MKKKSRWNPLVVIAVVMGLLAGLVGYVLHRNTLAVESKRYNALVGQASNAISRAVLIHPAEYNKVDYAFYTKLAWELRRKYGQEVTQKASFCRLDSDGNLMALLPDGRKVKAEYGICTIGITRRVYSAIDKIVGNVLLFFPGIGWWATAVLYENVYRSVIYIPEELFADHDIKMKIIDAISDPCKYLPDYYTVAKQIENLDNKQGYNYNFGYLNSIACRDGSVPSYSVTLRIVKNNDYYKINIGTVSWFPDPGKDNYYEMTFTSKDEGE